MADKDTTYVYHFYVREVAIEDRGEMKFRLEIPFHVPIMAVDGYRGTPDEDWRVMATAKVVKHYIAKRGDPKEGMQLEVSMRGAIEGDWWKKLV